MTVARPSRPVLSCSFPVERKTLNDPWIDGFSARCSDSTRMSSVANVTSSSAFTVRAFNLFASHASCRPAVSLITSTGQGSLLGSRCRLSSTRPIASSDTEPTSLFVASGRDSVTPVVVVGSSPSCLPPQPQTANATANARVKAAWEVGDGIRDGIGTEHSLELRELKAKLLATGGEFVRVTRWTTPLFADIVWQGPSHLPSWDVEEVVVETEQIQALLMTRESITRSIRTRTMF